MAQRLVVAELLESETGVLEDLKEKALWKISGVHGNDKGFAARVLEDKVGTSLADSAIALA